MSTSSKGEKLFMAVAGTSFAVVCVSIATLIAYVVIKIIFLGGL